MARKGWMARPVGIVEKVVGTWTVGKGDMWATVRRTGVRRQQVHDSDGDKHMLRRKESKSRRCDGDCGHDLMLLTHGVKAGANRWDGPAVIDKQWHVLRGEREGKRANIPQGRGRWSLFWKRETHL